MHILKVFTQLQLEEIPAKYILKRYTKDARSKVEWEKHDVVQVGPKGNTD